MLYYHYFVITYLINQVQSQYMATLTKEAIGFSHWSEFQVVYQVGQFQAVYDIVEHRP